MFNFCLPSRLLTPVLVDAYKFVPGNVLLPSQSEFKIFVARRDRKWSAILLCS